MDRVYRILDIYGHSSAVRLITPTTSAKILDTIKILPNRKAQGHDSINNNVLKKLPISYVSLNSALINAIFELHCILETWKKSIIVPFKKPNSHPALAKIYPPPIIILPTLRKVKDNIFSQKIN